MTTTTLNPAHRLSVLAAAAILAGCGVFGDEGERYEKLDRLRVLGIRSEPPQLLLGETATLSANVFEPELRELSYEWSWCPARGDSSESFACRVSERELQRAWVAAGLPGSAPQYELGTDAEAQLTHVLAPELVSALCRAPALDERLQLACFEGLEASVKLTVRSSEAELTAIKSVTFLPNDASEAERNINPRSGFELTLHDDTDDELVASDQPLRAGHRYTVVAGVDDAAAERFTPAALPGEPPPRERRETLVMTWFVTVGEVLAPDGDDGFGGDGNPRTTFVDGSNDLEDLRRNDWQLPLTAGPRAQLHLVLRDERGGVGWTSRDFDVVGGEK